MKRFLMATNLGATSRFALARAFLLARARNAALHILYVADDGDDALARHVEATIGWLEQELEDDFGAGFAATSVKRTSGPVVEAIVAEAQAVGAELLIVGVTEHPHGDRILEGTILEQLLVNAPLPLLVVRNEPRGHYENVMVGLDLGPTSPFVLECALKVAPTGHFTIVHAQETEDRDMSVRQRINEIVRRCIVLAEREVNLADSSLVIRVDTGSVGAVITRHAELARPDLVAFGKHTKGISADAHLGTGARAILEGLEGDMLVTIAGGRGRPTTMMT